MNERPKHDGNHMPPPDLHCRHIGAHNMESDLCFLQLMQRKRGHSSEEQVFVTESEERKMPASRTGNRCSDKAIVTSRCQLC